MSAANTTGKRGSKKKKRAAMPLDPKKLMELMSDLGQAREVPAYVNLVIDVTASDRLIDCILRAFYTENPDTEVRKVLLADRLPSLPMPSDLCVIVTGQSLKVGALAALSRRLGCPCVLAIEAGQTFFAEEEQQACELAGVSADSKIIGVPLDDIVEVDFATPRPLDELGRWIVGNAPAKRVSMAADFPFMRYPFGVELTRLIAAQNGAVGVVLLVPGADMPVITFNQAKLVLQIASVYGQPLDYGRAAELAAVVAGAFGFRALARELSDTVPALGWGIKGCVAYSGTLAMGMAALEYFEEGGRINGLASKLREAVDSLIAAADAASDEPAL